MRPKDVFLATAWGKMSEKDGRFSTMQQNNLYFEPKYPTSSGADWVSLSNHHLLFERKAMDTVKRKAGKRAIRTVVPMLFLLLASCLHAQDRQYKFRLIDASDGLSDGQIRKKVVSPSRPVSFWTFTTVPRSTDSRTTRHVNTFGHTTVRPKSITTVKDGCGSKSWATCFCSTWRAGNMIIPSPRCWLPWE